MRAEEQKGYLGMLNSSRSQEGWAFKQLPGFNQDRRRPFIAQESPTNLWDPDYYVVTRPLYE